MEKYYRKRMYQSSTNGLIIKKEYNKISKKPQKLRDLNTNNRELAVVRRGFFLNNRSSTQNSLKHAGTTSRYLKPTRA